MIVAKTQTYIILLASLFFLCILSIIVNVSFLKNIDFSLFNEQGEFLIDAYYYFHLAGKIIGDVKNGSGFFDSLIFYSPNNSTIGIVFLSVVITYIVDTIYFINFLFLFAYALLTYLLLKRVELNHILFISAFFALIPYLFIVSKESVLVISYLLLAITVYSDRLTEKIVFFFCFLVLGLLSRPEFVLICIISFFTLLVLSLKYKKSLIIVIICVVVFSPVFEYINLISFAFQRSAIEVGSAQCVFYSIDVCVEKGEMNINEFFSRFILYFTYPIKWSIDLIKFLLNEAFVGYAFTIKLFYFLSSITVSYSVYSLFQCKETCKKKQFLITIPFIYILIYSCVFFYQGSRQFSVAIMLLAISLSIQMKKRENRDF